MDTVNGLAVSGAGDVYIACFSCDKIYKVSGGSISHIAGGGVLSPNNVSATSASVYTTNPFEVALDSGNNVFISLNGDGIYRIDANTQIITKFAGAPNGSCVNPPYINDGGPALSACLGDVPGLTVDISTNDLYVSDSLGESFGDVLLTDGVHHLVRRIAHSPERSWERRSGGISPRFGRERNSGWRILLRRAQGSARLRKGWRSMRQAICFIGD